MLKDRRVLVEQEIEKLKTQCSTLYGQIAFTGSVVVQGTKTLEYDSALQQLQTRLTEKLLIDELIAKGNP